MALRKPLNWPSIDKDEITAVFLMVVMVLYWVFIYPFVYHALLVYALWYSKLCNKEAVERLLKYEDKYAISAIEGWLQEVGDETILCYREYPTWHPATKRITVYERGWGGSKVSVVCHRM